MKCFSNLRPSEDCCPVIYKLRPTSCCSFILSPSNALLASSRASTRRAFFSLSAAPSLSALTSPCSRCTSVSRILMVRASSASCCRASDSRTVAISRSFSSWSLARRSVSATACLCCSSSRACRWSCSLSRSLHIWKRRTVVSLQVSHTVSMLICTSALIRIWFSSFLLTFENSYIPIILLQPSHLVPLLLQLDLGVHEFAPQFLIGGLRWWVGHHLWLLWLPALLKGWGHSRCGRWHSTLATQSGRTKSANLSRESVTAPPPYETQHHHHHHQHHVVVRSTLLLKAAWGFCLRETKRKEVGKVSQWRKKRKLGYTKVLFKMHWT